MLELVGYRRCRVPAVVVVFQIAAAIVVRVRNERAHTAIGARHIRRIDEPHLLPVRVRAGHVVADFQIKDVRAVDFREM